MVCDDVGVTPRFFWLSVREKDANAPTTRGAFTYIEAILGQLYLALMIARLVGLYIIKRQS
jgi:hypothetical protein